MYENIFPQYVISDIDMFKKSIQVAQIMGFEYLDIYFTDKSIELHKISEHHTNYFLMCITNDIEIKNKINNLNKCVYNISVLKLLTFIKKIENYINEIIFEPREYELNISTKCQYFSINYLENIQKNVINYKLNFDCKYDVKIDSSELLETIKCVHKHDDILKINCCKNSIEFSGKTIRLCYPNSDKLSIESINKSENNDNISSSTSNIIIEQKSISLIKILSHVNKFCENIKLQFICEEQSPLIINCDTKYGFFGIFIMPVNVNDY